MKDSSMGGRDSDGKNGKAEDPHLGLEGVDNEEMLEVSLAHLPCPPRKVAFYTNGVEKLAIIAITQSRPGTNTIQRSIRARDLEAAPPGRVL